jgi:hypothetical protein
VDFHQQVGEANGTFCEVDWEEEAYAQAC